MQPSFIAGIGGSAGGVVAYKALLNSLPGTSGMAFVVVSHFLPTASSHLASILSRHTRMPVTVASMSMLIEPNQIYVCPPNADLLVEEETFKLVHPRTRNRQVDLFMTSLAEDARGRAIGIVLSG